MNRHPWMSDAPWEKYKVYFKYSLGSDALCRPILQKTIMTWWN